MATFADIKETRLRIADPYLFKDILNVSLIASLPGSPASQTVYLVDEDENYYAYDSVSSIWEIQEVRISDTRLSTWIDYNGVNYATCRALKQIIAQLGVELGGIKKNQTGAESTEYNSIVDMLSYYRTLLADCKEDAKEEAGNSTGRLGKISAVEIAGGNL